MNFLQSIIIFLFGITFGSFLNVCIYRIPKKEDIVKTPSHCMKCGYELKWYDLVPLFSFIALKGKCRKCGTKLSLQYPIIEAVNGFIYVLVFAHFHIILEDYLYMDHIGRIVPLLDVMLICAFMSVLLVISVIDFRTYEIPFGCNVFIFVLGILSLVLHPQDWLNHVIGLFAISLFLLLLYVCTKGRGIGGGDIKLMAAAGFFLGWKLIILAFFVGCILGSILHILRMKISKADHVLAFGPYLSMGLAIAVLYGDRMLNWYLGFLM